MVTKWALEEMLKDIHYLDTQEEQICRLLKCFYELFPSDKLSFFRFSPVGYVGEGVAIIENGNMRSFTYIRDDIRSLPAIRKVVEERWAAFYEGEHYITNVSSRYQQDKPLLGLLVVPIFIHNMTISYICSEYVSYIPQFQAHNFAQFTLFGEMAAKILIQHDAPPHPRLSPRENEIIRAIANGLSTKEMSDVLDLSEATIKQYIKSALMKLGAKNRAHAVSLYLARK
ncbi:helix-turn-helix transcriptional regulator [Solibacillus sp. CAU 1738]|uniref:helix-turn-helix domain-containing protein n=1 Tax=Solibacillus sp. CAU 1738 TaxID=3140363 RepID=UPI00326187A5